MIIRRFLLALLTATCFLSLPHAQTSLSPGYVTFGLNGGLSYQTSDVKARLNGFGAGATLAKNLYYHPASPFTFDVRGRFLYARQYGLDGARSFDIANNIALNGQLDLDYLNYPAQLGVSEGFVFHNHRTSVGELAAEAVLSWHTNRMGPGLFFSLYGGAGFYYYLTRIDQADTFGEAYYEAYAGLDGRTGQNRRALRNDILDGTFETVADNLNRTGTMNLAPSLGLEAGLQLTPRFALLIGHRITFSGDNLLDGHQWEDARGDWYHYTSLGLAWTLSAGRENTRARAPQISIIYPKPLPHTTANSNGLVKARVTGVDNSSNIACTVNGQHMPFDFYNGDLTISFPLVPGQNTVQIRAFNDIGRDIESALIIFRPTGGGTGVTPPAPPQQPPAPPRPLPQPPPPAGKKPNVDFMDPSTSPFYTQSASVQIRVRVEEVSDKNSIRMEVNGQNRSDFYFNPSKEEVTATLSVQTGNTEIKVRASNSYGTDEDKLTVVRTEAQQPPVVTINQPSTAESETQKPTASIRATLENVRNSSEITYTVNGQRVSGFEFNASTGVLTHLASLKEGPNNIAIKAVTSAGSDQASVKITYEKPAPPPPPPPPPPPALPKPVITFSVPAQPGAVAIRTPYVVKASILHIKGSADLTFLVNGKAAKGFQFDKGQFSANINLNEGRNDIEIKAKNQAGETIAQTHVTLRKTKPQDPRGNKPEVTITLVTQPASNPFNPNLATSTLEATIKNVPSKQQIAFTINDQAVTDFEFDPETGAFKAVLRLERGSNQVVLKATTRAGTDQDERTIDF